MKILLSFDIEEFDMPFEYQRDISFERQLAISREGAECILRLLKENGIKATFYTTANLARNEQDLVKQMVAEGHEVASHGLYHSRFEPEHLREAKEILESISATEVVGFRMPRMFPVSNETLLEAGYLYSSSINPTFLPGRYNHLDKPRTCFSEGGLWQLPASVTPGVRFPLFWLSFHNLPFSVYAALCAWTIRTDGYMNVYFHPWEFYEIGPKSKFNFPFYVTRNTGKTMYERLGRFIRWGLKKGYDFERTGDFIRQKAMETGNA